MGETMARPLLTIDEMQRLLLDNIRARPRCHEVITVTVDRIRSNGYGNNWKIGTISYGLASKERVDRAAAQTQAKVCPHYDLLED